MPKIMLRTFKNIEIKVNSHIPEMCSVYCDHYQLNDKAGEFYCDITRSVIVDGKRTKQCVEGQ